MNGYSAPPGPIPEPLRGDEIGSFAHDTMIRRIPGILRKTIVENHFPPEIETKLTTLLREIPYGPIRLLEDNGAPDTADWNQQIVGYTGKNWLQVPWFFAETYFFRRILEATGYFQDGPGKGVDPFLSQKTEALEINREKIAAIAEKSRSWRLDASAQESAVSNLMLLNLWGNQADLSLWPAGAENRPDHQEEASQKAHVLIDNRQLAAASVCQPLEQVEKRRVDFIVDNSGLELTLDLFLADMILTKGCVRQVKFWLKNHPTYVSDAMRKDVEHTLQSLGAHPDEDVRQLASRLAEHRRQGSLILEEHPFWTSPLPAWEMPDGLYTDLAQSSLVIIKGDANYRRFLGDRHWRYTFPFEEIVRYRPAPLLAIRVLKAEVCAGLEPGQPESMTARDPNWLTDGQWGIIQYAGPQS